MAKRSNKSVLALTLLAMLSLSACGNVANAGVKGGTQWLTGTEVPTELTGGNVGDFYFDVDDNDIYQLTENGWTLLTNIKGDKGDTGAQGEKGDKGDTGAQGEKGDKGDTGAQGEKGDKGDTGAQGEKGDKGDTGAQGEKGDKGDTGEQGEKGDKGDKGEDGLTPFIGENGNWWIGDKDTGVKAEGKDGVDGEPGEKGEQGEPGTPGEKGEDGVSVENIDIEYGYDENGNETVIFTITYSDGRTEVIESLLPVKVREVYGLTQNRFAMLEEGEENKYSLTARVWYENDEMGEVVLTKENIIKGEVNFYKAGTYTIYYEIQGIEQEAIITVYDPNDDSIESMGLSFDSKQLVILDENGNIPEDFYNDKFIFVNRVNGASESIQLTPDMVIFEGDVVDGNIISARVEYEGFTEYFDLGCVSSYESLNVNNWWFNEEPNLLFNQNGEMLNEVSIQIEYEVFGFNGFMNIPLTKEMLPNLDVSQIGSVEYNFTLMDIPYIFPNDKTEKKQIIYVSIIDESSLKMNYIKQENNYYKVGATYENIIVTAYFGVQTEFGYYEVKKELSLAEIATEFYELNEVGDYWIPIQYNDYNGEVRISIYDPEVSNIRSVRLNGDIPYAIVGTTFEDYKAKLKDVSLNVYYYEPVNGKEMETISITDDMISSDTMIFDEVGSFDLIINYEEEGKKTHTINYHVSIYNDPKVCNIRSLGADIYGLSILDSESLDEFFENNVVGKELWVDYIEKVDGEYYTTVEITKDMIDYSEIDLSKTGYQEFYIEYGLEGQEKYRESFTIEVMKDMSTATVLGEYKFEEEVQNMYGFVMLKVYDNGMCSLYDGNDTYDTFECVIGEDGLFVYRGIYFEIDYDNKIVSQYVPEGDVVASFTWDAKEYYNQDFVYTFYFYEELNESREYICLCEVKVNGQLMKNTVSVNYDVKTNTIDLEGEIVLQVNEDGTLTIYEPNIEEAVAEYYWDAKKEMGADFKFYFFTELKESGNYIVLVDVVDEEESQPMTVVYDAETNSIYVPSGEFTLQLNEDGTLTLVE